MSSTGKEKKVVFFSAVQKNTVGGHGRGSVSLVQIVRCVGLGGHGQGQGNMRSRTNGQGLAWSREVGAWCAGPLKSQLL